MPDPVDELRDMSLRLARLEKWIADNFRVGERPITGAQIPDDTILGRHILARTIGGEDIALNTILGENVSPATLVGAHLQDATVNLATKVVGTLPTANLPPIGTAQLLGNAATVVRWGLGTTSGPASPASFATIPEMAVTTDFGGNALHAFLSIGLTGAGGSMVDIVLNDGSADHGDSYRRVAIPTAGWVTVAIDCPLQPAASLRTLAWRWQTVSPSGAVTASATQRNMTVVEYRR